MNDLRWSGLRQLDVDDLIVLTLLAEGKTATQVSDHLGLTPPAVSHRFTKYTDIFDKEEFFLKVKGRRIPSEYGMRMCRIAQEALKVLTCEEEDPEN